VRISPSFEYTTPLPSPLSVKTVTTEGWTLLTIAGIPTCPWPGVIWPSDAPPEALPDAPASALPEDCGDDGTGTCPGAVHPDRIVASSAAAHMLPPMREIRRGVGFRGCIGTSFPVMWPVPAAHPGTRSIRRGRRARVRAAPADAGQPLRRDTCRFQGREYARPEPWSASPPPSWVPPHGAGVKTRPCRSKPLSTRGAKPLFMYWIVFVFASVWNTSGRRHCHG
jgi:hypothetical protein